MNTVTMTWNTDKDAGAQAYSCQHYPEALTHYSNALEKLLSSSDDNSETTGAESPRTNVDAELRQQHQILLSNIVACRLKIGGMDNVTKAVQEAKQVRSTARFTVIPGMINIHSLVRVPPFARESCDEFNVSCHGPVDKAPLMFLLSLMCLPINFTWTVHTL